MNYEKIYNNLIYKAIEEGVDGYYERHHIIPRAFGLDDNRVVHLSIEQHYLAHLLLYKIFGGNAIFAVEAFYDRNRYKHLDIKDMPKWIRKRITLQRAALHRSTKR